MPDDDLGRHTEGAPHRRERSHLHEQRGLYQRSGVVGGCVAIGIVVEEIRPRGAPGKLLEDRVETFDLRGEGRAVPVIQRTHTGPLSALPRKDQGDARPPRRTVGAYDGRVVGPGGDGPQSLDERGSVTGRHQRPEPPDRPRSKQHAAQLIWADMRRPGQIVGEGCALGPQQRGGVGGHHHGTRPVRESQGGHRGPHRRAGVAASATSRSATSRRWSFT